MAISQKGQIDMFVFNIYQRIDFFSVLLENANKNIWSRATSEGFVPKYVLFFEKNLAYFIQRFPFAQ